MGYLTNQGSIRPTKFSFDNAITIPNRPTIPAFDGTSFNPQVVDILTYQTNTSNVLIPASNFQLGRTFAGSNLNSRLDGKSFLLFENEVEYPKTYFYLDTTRDPLFGASYNVIANIGGRGPGSSVPVAFYSVAPYVENISDSTYTFSFEEVPGEPGKLTNFYIFNLTYRSLYKFTHHFEHEGESDSPSATSYFIANSPTVSKDSVESSINNIFNQAGALNGDVFVVEKMEYIGEYIPMVYTSSHSQPYDGFVNTVITSDSPSSRKIIRISPRIDVFKKGESQVLDYALVDVLGNILSNSPTELLVYPGTGWGYTEETKTLQYIEGNWRTLATVKFTYEEQEYSLYDRFYPEGFGLYDPGNSEEIGGIGPGGAGGTGNFGKNEVSDSIDVPSGSVAGDASATGMFTRYLVNSSYLDILGDWLWTTDLGLQIAKTIISSIYGNPAESVISLMSYPFDIKTLSGVTSKTQNLFWGNHDSGLAFIALTSQSATVDWGTITLEEYWGNFLDYEPHTKIELYLPWGTGFVSIDPNMCLPGTLRVVTNIDLCKGSCVHNVIGNNNVVIGTYAGQCSQQIPIISNDYASKVAGVVVSATALAVAGTAGGGAISAGREAEIAYGRTHSLPFGDVNGTAEYMRGIETASAMAQAPYHATQRTAARLAAGSSLAALKRSGTVSRNGSFTDGSASLGVQYPYIILSRPSQSVPEQYGSHYGYPSNIYTRLGTIKGYTEVGEIHLNGISATDAEISELDSILKGGVIF